jgi:hypothetical protein
MPLEDSWTRERFEHELTSSDGYWTHEHQHLLTEIMSELRYRNVQLYLQPREWFEDLLQDFLLVYREKMWSCKATTFKAYKAFLRRCLHNFAIDKLKSENHTRQKPENRPVHVDLDEADTLDRATILRLQNLDFEDIQWYRNVARNRQTARYRFIRINLSRTLSTVVLTSPRDYDSHRLPTFDALHKLLSRRTHKGDPPAFQAVLPLIKSIAQGFDRKPCKEWCRSVTQADSRDVPLSENDLQASAEHCQHCDQCQAFLNEQFSRQVQISVFPSVTSLTFSSCFNHRTIYLPTSKALLSAVAIFLRLARYSRRIPCPWSGVFDHMDGRRRRTQSPRFDLLRKNHLLFR